MTGGLHIRRWRIRRRVREKLRESTSGIHLFNYHTKLAIIIASQPSAPKSFPLDWLIIGRWWCQYYSSIPCNTSKLNVWCSLKTDVLSNNFDWKVNSLRAKFLGNNESSSQLVQSCSKPLFEQVFLCKKWKSSFHASNSRFSKWKNQHRRVLA
jgi:hypothetical protein